MKTPYLAAILLACAALAACAGPSHKPQELVRVTPDSPVFEPSPTTWPASLSSR